MGQPAHMSVMLLRICASAWLSTGLSNLHLWFKVYEGGGFPMSYNAKLLHRAGGNATTLIDACFEDSQTAFPDDAAAEPFTGIWAPNEPLVSFLAHGLGRAQTWPDMAVTASVYGAAPEETIGSIFNVSVTMCFGPPSAPSPLPTTLVLPTPSPSPPAPSPLPLQLLSLSTPSPSPRSAPSPLPTTLLLPTPSPSPPAPLPLPLQLLSPSTSSPLAPLQSLLLPLPMPPSPNPTGMEGWAMGPLETALATGALLLACLTFSLGWSKRRRKQYEKAGVVLEDEHILVE